jgi:hypothetical protein
VDVLATLGKRCTGVQEHVESELFERFPPGQTVITADPCVIIDSEGFILLWFLPGLLKPKRRVCHL